MKICKNCGRENFGFYTECSNCKAPLDEIRPEFEDESPPACMRPKQNNYQKGYVLTESRPSDLQVAAKIFMILSTVAAGIGLLICLGFFIFALLARSEANGASGAQELVFLMWIYQSITIVLFSVTLYMTCSYSRKIFDRKRVGVGFKICTLLFISPIAGILMLCDNK